MLNNDLQELVSSNQSSTGQAYTLQKVHQKQVITRLPHQFNEPSETKPWNSKSLKSEGQGFKPFGKSQHSKRQEAGNIPIEITHKIPTTSFIVQGVSPLHQGGIRIGTGTSMDTQQQIRISPRFAPFKANLSCEDDIGINMRLQDSRLTNLVLDDFRKQVHGLEQQVNQNQSNHGSAMSKHLDSPSKHKDSTDLDDSRPVFPSLQPRDGKEIRLPSMEVSNQNFGGYGASGKTDNNFFRNALHPAENNSTQQAITTHQLQEIRRKIQRRQQGIKSEEKSYLTKLDPTIVERQHQQQQVIFNGRYLHSMGSSRPQNEINREQQKVAKHGQNLFMKSFVQNEKNSNMFNQFMARASMSLVNNSIALPNPTQTHLNINQQFLAVMPAQFEQHARLPVYAHQTFNNCKPIHQQQQPVLKFKKLSNDEIQAQGEVVITLGNSRPITTQQQSATNETASDLTETKYDTMHLKNENPFQTETSHPLKKVESEDDGLTSESFAQLQIIGGSTFRKHEEPDKLQKKTKLKIQNFPSPLYPLKYNKNGKIISPRDMQGLVSQGTSNDHVKDFNVNGVVGGGESINSNRDRRVNRVAIAVHNSPQTKNNLATRSYSLVESRPKSPRKQAQKTFVSKSLRSTVASPGQPKRKTLASLISVNSVSELSLTSQTGQPAPVNIQIKLMTSHETEFEPDCNCKNQDNGHEPSCFLAPSQIFQVAQTVNKRFHKYDIKFKLAKNLEKRQNLLLHPQLNQTQKYKREKQAHQKFANSQCQCQDRPCCTLSPNSTVIDCHCVQHSFKYQYATRDIYNKYAAADSALDVADSIGRLDFEGSRTTFLPKKKIFQVFHGRHKTMERWTRASFGKNDLKKQNQQGSETASQSNRRNRVSLTQALLNGQDSGGRFQMREQRILDGKLPTIDPENFASANSITGARVTFINQLRRNSKQGLSPRENDLQSSRFGGQQGELPRSFNQIIADAKQQANNTNSVKHQPQKLLNGVKSDHINAQSIFSAAFENTDNSVLRNNTSIFDPGTSLLLAEHQNGSLQANVPASRLSVKKQLRLQKMALQGIDYRPKHQVKIFDSRDIKEIFRYSMEKNQVSSVDRSQAMFDSHQKHNASGGFVDSRIGDSIFLNGQSKQLVTDRNVEQHNSVSDNPSKNQFFHQSQHLSSGLNDNYPTTNAKVQQMTTTGGASFKPEIRIYEEGLSPISNLMRNLNFQHSKDTEEWLKQDEQKKLAQSRHNIKRLTADPIMTIEQTKAKNNNAMIRKIQRKIKSKRFQKNYREGAQQEFLLNKANYSADQTLIEESIQSQKSLSGAARKQEVFKSTAANQSFDLRSYQEISANQATHQNLQIPDKMLKKRTEDQKSANSRAAGMFEKSSLFRPTKPSVAQTTHQRQSPVPQAKPIQATRGVNAWKRQETHIATPPLQIIGQSSSLITDTTQLHQQSKEVTLNEPRKKHSIIRVDVNRSSFDRFKTFELKADFDQAGIFTAVQSVEKFGHQSPMNKMSMIAEQNAQISQKGVKESFKSGERMLRYSKEEWSKLLSEQKDQP